MTARRQPQAHSACPTGGERVDTARCVDCRSVAIDSFVDRQGTGILPLVAGGGEANEDPGTSSCLRYYCSCPRVCSISCTGYTLFFYWLGLRESSGVEAIHTWTGDALGRGPYQAVTALNSLRYRLGRYPVVARRCLASTPLDTVAHQAGRRWHSDSDQPLRQFTPSARVRAAALRAGFSEQIGYRPRGGG